MSQNSGEILYSRGMNRNMNVGELNFEPNLNIHDLPADIIHEMRKLMDPHAHWRRLAELTEDKFPLGQFIENIALEIHKPHGSPTEKLLRKLSSLDMRVQDLVGYLDILKLEPILLKLKQYESIEIIRQPEKNITVKEGEELILSVEASGFPYPRYQWFKMRVNAFERLNGQSENSFIVPAASLCHEGTYCCRLHNSQESENVTFTDHIHVKVNPGKSNVMLTENFHQLSIQPSPVMCQRLPVIIQHPGSVSVAKGQGFMLACQADGELPLEFQWFKNSRILPQFSGPALKIESADANDGGNYQCVVYNNSGNASSQPALVQVQASQYELIESDLEITAQPKSCSVVIGGSALFKCEAMCRLGIQPTYQWYHKGQLKPNAHSQCLELHNIQDRNEEGYYCCRVVVRIGDQELSCLSSMATLNIIRSNEKPEYLPEYHPSDKVALLIGNYDYRNEVPLSAPKPDVHVMGDIFRSLDFKVVALLNLTKSEMMSMVETFCELLGPKVYSIFYFCGHGFEEDGNCYLVPQDPPAGYIKSDCVCAEVVQAKMQNTNASLICLILDICRKPNKVSSTGSPNIITNQKGKTIVLYATSQRMNAYEETKTGLLVHYLQPFLKQQKPIEEVFRDFRAAFARDHPNVEQIPEVKSNLQNVHISLADKISYKGDTKAFTRRTLQWKNAHEQPRPELIVMDQLRTKVQLEFQSDFSNVLHVFVTVVDLGLAKDCYAYIRDWPSAVSVMGGIQRLPSHKNRTKTTLQDLQKLQTNLIVSVVVRCKSDGQHSEETQRIDLGRPLVSALNIGHNTYENVADFQQGREPQQHVEDYSSVDDSCSQE